MRRRLAMLLSATLVAGIAAVLVPASPASAGVHVCGGVGGATLGQGLTYPVTVSTDLPPHPVHVLAIRQPRTTTFNFGFTQIGACVNTNAPTVKSTLTGTGVTASGTVSGWCGLSSGTGTVTLGPSSGRFAWIGIGGTLVTTGAVVGVVAAIPDTLAGQSCNRELGANQFTVAGGAVAFDHCAPTAPKHIPTVPTNGNLDTLINIPPGVLQTILISLTINTPPLTPPLPPIDVPIAAVSAHAAGTLHIYTKVCAPVLVLL